MVRNFAQKVRMHWISTTLRRVYADLRERVILQRKGVILRSTLNYANNSAIMVRTMLRCNGNAEQFWSIARRCAAGNQLAAVLDICTSSSCVVSCSPVHGVCSLAVEHFLTARSDAFEAQNCLHT